MPLVIRDVLEHELDSVLALNNAVGPGILALDAARMRWFFEHASYFRVAEIDGRLAGFLIALRESADYSSPNFLWFRERYPAFVYIDRIVIAEPFRGHGLGRIFYCDVTSYAELRVPLLTCEVFLEPRDDVAVLFHGTYGFNEVGQQLMPGIGRPVSLLARPNAASSSCATPVARRQEGRACRGSANAQVRLPAIRLPRERGQAAWRAPDSARTGRRTEVRRGRHRQSRSSATTPKRCRPNWPKDADRAAAVHPHAGRARPQSPAELPDAGHVRDLFEHPRRRHDAGRPFYGTSANEALARFDVPLFAKFRAAFNAPPTAPPRRRRPRRRRRTDTPPPPSRQPAGTLFGDSPVRSGQQIYARGGDLVRPAGRQRRRTSPTARSTSTALRERHRRRRHLGAHLLPGIPCGLVSIAGQYRVFGSLSNRGQPVQVWLEGKAAAGEARLTAETDKSHMENVLD